MLVLWLFPLWRMAFYQENTGKVCSLTKSMITEVICRSLLMKQWNRELLALLNEMAENKNATPAQISMAWMLCKKPWIVPIPGTRKLDRLQENAKAAEIKLTDVEVKALDEALDQMEMSEVFGGSLE